MTNELDQIAMSAALDRIRQLECETVPREVADWLAKLLQREIRKCTGNTCHCAEINDALAAYRKAVAGGE